MRLKGDTVKIQGIRPELLFAMFVVDQEFRDIAQEELVITSVVDGIHSRTSLHYSGAAFDCRIWNIATHKVNRLVPRIAEKLGIDFDVVLESNHIHIEFQPKVR